MATAKETVDGILGDGSYDEWMNMENATAHEKKRTDYLKVRFRFVYFQPGASTSPYWDTDLLVNIMEDYRDEMNLVARAQSVDTRKIEQLHTILTVALGLVEHNNDAVDAAVSIGLVATFFTLPFALLAPRAKRLLELLEVLKKHLEQAKTERLEAGAQTAINAALTVITIFGPHIGLLARGALVVGQGLLDGALGPSKSKAAKAGSKASHIVAEFGEAVSESENFGQNTRRIAGRAGRAALATGFVFDVDEVFTGHRNVNEIRAAISQVNAAYDSLMAEIKKHKPAIVKFVSDHQRWQTRIKDIVKTADKLRDTLQDEIRRTGYTPHIV
jgi:hypothetical protein